MDTSTFRNSKRARQQRAAALFTTFVFLLFSSFTNTPASGTSNDAIDVVRVWADQKLTALETKDRDAYRSLLDESEPEYLVEQRNWFINYSESTVLNYAIEVIDATFVDDRTIEASIRESYDFVGKKKDRRSVRYIARFVASDTGWKDSGYAFRSLETEHFVIKYPKGQEGSAVAMSASAEIGYASVIGLLVVKPENPTVIKMYPSRELLRHTSDIRIEWLFDGWYEYGESIKHYSQTDSKHYARAIAHELAHKITLGITDGMCTWLAEGIADHFGGNPLAGGNAIDSGAFKPGDFDKSVSWLETFDFLGSSDARLVGTFYSMAALVVECLDERYGTDKLLELLRTLGRNAPVTRGYDYSAMEKENIVRVRDSIYRVYDLSFEELDVLWMDWIEYHEQREEARLMEPGTSPYGAAATKASGLVKSSGMVGARVPSCVLSI